MCCIMKSFLNGAKGRVAYCLGFARHQENDEWNSNAGWIDMDLAVFENARV